MPPKKRHLALLYWKGSDIAGLVSIMLPSGRTSSQLPLPRKSKIHVHYFRHFILYPMHLVQIKIVRGWLKYLLTLQCSFNFEGITFLKGNDLLKIVSCLKSRCYCILVYWNVILFLVACLIKSDWAIISHALNQVCEINHESVFTKLCSSELSKTEVFWDDLLLNSSSNELLFSSRYNNCVTINITV